MDRTAAAFWGLITVLLTASVFFGLHGEQRRRSVQAANGSLANGDLVRLVRTIDGDSVLVAKDRQPPVAVRLLGIKSFDAKVAKDAGGSFGQAAIAAIEHLAHQRPARVMLGPTRQDKAGRYLAALYVDDQDLALQLLKRGLVIAYTVYPFPAMPLYLDEQEKAKAARQGLWAHPAAERQAEALIAAMRVQAR